MKKRLLSALLAMCIVSALLPGTAWAAEYSGSLDQTDYALSYASAGSGNTGGSAGTPEPGIFQLIYVGDWDGLGLSKAYQEIVAYQFREIYPKLMARWGCIGTEARTVTLYADPDYSGVAATSAQRASMRVSSAYMRQNRTDVGFFTHELMHIVQGYGSFQSSWWTENFADYVRFRYFACAAGGSWNEKTYSESDPAVRNWDWNPYGKCAWFFAYLDARYPTRKMPDGSVKLGLIDTINAAIKKGELTGDGGKEHSNKAFNAIVERMTGYGNMELLRQQYVRELDKGSWRFEGFDDYEDNFLTENVSPEVNIVWMRDNLLSGAGIHDFQGLNHPDYSPAMLIDGDTATNWQCGLVHGDACPYIVLDMGKSRKFNCYSLFTYYTNYPAAWELLVSDDACTWRCVDRRLQQNFTNASYRIAATSGRYVMLRITSAPKGPILNELMLFDSAIASGDSPTRYTVSAPAGVTGGSAELSSNSAVRGAVVTITVTPYDGYKLDSLTAADAGGNALALTKVSDTQYTFIMPASQVTVGVTFTAIGSHWVNPFTDVSERDWFYEFIAYVEQIGLMSSVGNQQFGPYGATTRGMIMTILARMNGVDTSASSPWYKIGMEWAMREGVSDGTNPGANITREQFAVMLWRYAGEPAVTGDLSVYSDADKVHDWARAAMVWAVRNGIIQGSGGKLDPQGNALRSQSAAMLTRFCRNIKGRFFQGD